MKYVFILLFLFSCGSEPENNAITLARKVKELQMKGIISGFDCATVNIPCPEEHKDHTETLGLFNEADEEFSFMVNIPRSFFEQYFLDSIVVEGKIYNGVKNAIEPTEISILNKKGEKTTIFIDGHFVDEHNHKSTFRDGDIVNGVWLCKECLTQ